MIRCYLSIGSNQKNPERQIRNSIKNIKKIPATYITQVSSLYWTKAWGIQSQQDFCNAAIELTTHLDPYELLYHCQKIEQKQGRVRKKRWGPRTLDIDIILFGNRIIKTPTLTIPHPYFKVRSFVTAPLHELNPSLDIN